MVDKQDMKTNQMNGLYPIIRRVRRPLMPVDAPADAKPAVTLVAPVPVAPVPAVQAVQAEEAERSKPVAKSKPEKRKVKHGESTATEPAQ